MLLVFVEIVMKCFVIFFLLFVVFRNYECVVWVFVIVFWVVKVLEVIIKSVVFGLYCFRVFVMWVLLMLDIKCICIFGF